MGRPRARGRLLPLKKRLHRIRGRLIRIGPADTHLLPSFLILGAMKAGTSALFHHLCSHSCVVAPRIKELRYFDAVHRYEDFGDYRREFPNRHVMELVRRRHGIAMTGEATPGYLSHPCAPARVRAVLPDIRLVATLREPVARAYSHYHHDRRHGHEDLTSFEDAVAAELTRLASWDDGRVDDDTAPAPWEGGSYLYRGLYADQLQRWFREFPREQILTVRAEDLRLRPEPTFARVLDHIGLPPAGSRVRLGSRHEGSYDEMDPALRRDLGAFFSEPNRRLDELVGIRWDDV